MYARPQGCVEVENLVARQAAQANAAEAGAGSRRHGKRLGHGMMLIPTALEVDAMVRKIPRGQVSTIAQIRRRLARWHNVDVTCPLVTGIFLRIVAEAAEEDRASGRHDITPYWRVVRRRWRVECEVSGGTRGAGAAADG